MTMPAAALAALFDLDLDVAEVYAEAAHALAYLAAGRAVRDSVDDAAATVSWAVAFASNDAAPTIEPSGLLAVAIAQHLAQMIRTLSLGSEHPLAANLRTYEQLTDVHAAQLPAEVERFLAAHLRGIS